MTRLLNPAHWVRFSRLNCLEESSVAKEKTDNVGRVEGNEDTTAASELVDDIQVTVTDFEVSN